MKDLKQSLLDAIAVLEPNAYGVPIHMKLESYGVKVSYGGMYIALEELERDGYVTSHHSDATTERGGGPKRFFQLTGRKEPQDTPCLVPKLA